MQAWHLTFAADGRNALFADEADRRAAVRRLARVAGERIVLFCLVDEHIHVVVIGKRKHVGLVGRSILLALRKVVASKLDPARIRPVDGRSHLEWLVRYVLDQPRHHGLAWHPALFSGSCFPDLVGARVVGGLQLRLKDVLPRFRLRQAHEAVGLVGEKLEPLAGLAIRRLGAYRLVEAAAAALCVAFPPEGKQSAVTAARAAACAIARDSGIATSEVVNVLGVTHQAANRLARKSVEERVLRAVRLRLALEVAVDAQARRP